MSKVTRNGGPPYILLMAQSVIAPKGASVNGGEQVQVEPCDLTDGCSAAIGAPCAIGLASQIT